MQENLEPKKDVTKKVVSTQSYYKPCPRCGEPMSLHRKICMACQGAGIKDRIITGINGNKRYL